MNRNDGIPAHLNPDQYRMAQQANQFGNHIQHLKDTGDTDALARIGGIFSNIGTTNFLFDYAKARNFAPGSMDLAKRHFSDPDTVHIGLSDDGPDYHHSGGTQRYESGYSRSVLQKKYRERIVKAEGRRAQMKGFDSPPSGPARDPNSLKTASERGIVNSRPYRRYY